MTHVVRISSRFPLAVLLLAAAAPASAGQVRGRLLNGDAPAAGVTVTAFPYATPTDEARREARGEEDPKPVTSTVTAPDGSFHLVLPDGGTRVVLRASGGGMCAVLFDGVYDAAESADLGERVLDPGGAIAGTVVDVSGAPVASVEVTLRAPAPGDADLLPAPIRTTSGGDGTFRLDGAAPTGNSLTFRKQGLAPFVSGNARAGALAKPVVLRPGTLLAGVVKPLPGKSPAGTLVRIEGRAETRWVEATGDGNFTIPDAPAGKGTVVADAGDAGWGEAAGVAVPLAEGKPLVVALAAPAVLDGRVVDAKTLRPIPRAKVELRDGAFVRAVRSGPDGRYRAAGLPPRTFRVSVDDPRYVPFVRGVTASAGETRKLDAPLVLAATLSGRVTDETGAPVAGAHGALVRGGESGFRALLRQLRGSGTGAFRTSADGTFRASRLMPGDNQRLTVGHADFASATIAGLSLVAGQTTANVSVVLRRGAVISGVVREPNGEPVAGAEVEVGAGFGFRGGRGGMQFQIGVAGGPSGPNARKTKSGPDGRFALKGMSPGDYTVIVRKPGLATERIDPVKVPEEGSPEPLAVTLVPGAAIAGVVKTRSGNPAEGWIVSAAKSGSSPIGPRAQRGGSPVGPDGSFFLDGLKAGETYDLSLLGGTGMSPGRRGVVAPAGDVEIVVAGTGRISGRAVDASSGRPLTEFQVAFEPDRMGGGGAIFRFASRAAGRRMSGIGEPTSVKSEDGTFTLEEVPAGTWSVVVTAKDYQPARAGGVVVEEGGTAKDVEVKASRGAALTGHVTDAATGRPVPNASVSHEDAGAGGGPMRGLVLDGGETEITTDADGRFEIDGLGAGKVHLTVKHPDYADASETVDVKESGASVELKLAAGGAIAGTVASETGQPLPGADVALAAAGEAGFGRGMLGGQSTTTDASGRFRFDHLGAGRYGVTAQLRTRSSAPVTVVLQAGQSNEALALSIAAGSTVRGTVSGIPDSWKSGMTVTANGPDGFFASTRTGADGRFEFGGVPAGAVALRATAGDFAGSSRSVMKQVTVDDSQPVIETELVFEPGFSLSGRVTRAGAPVVNATVIANLQGGGGRQAATHSDDAGAYRLDGLTGGTYQVITMTNLAGGASRRDTVTVDGDQTLDVVFPSAKLGGTVIDAAGRQPLPDAVVEVSAADTSAGPFVRSLTTDSNGAFLLADLDPKSYAVNVRKAGYQFSKRDVTAADEGTDTLVFELARGDGIGVVGRDGLFGVPLRGLLVRVTDSQQAVVFQGSIALDADGNGEIPSLRPGTYVLMADASGYAAVTIPNVSVPSSPVTVSLTPGGSLEIRSGPKTLAAGTARVHLRTMAGGPVPLSLFSPTGDVVISTPVRRLENIAPGSYLLTVDGGGSNPFSVQEGGLSILNLP